MNLRQQHWIFITAIWALLISGVSAQDDEFRVGVVDIQKVFREYYKTSETQKQLNTSRTLVQKKGLEARAKVIEFRKLIEAETNIAFDKEKALTEEEREIQKKKTQYLQEQLQMRVQQTNQAHQAELDKLNSQMTLKMDAILAEIRKLAQAHSEKANLQITFDISGNTTSQLPFFFPTAKTIDITSHLIKELNKDDPRLKK